MKEWRNTFKLVLDLRQKSDEISYDKPLQKIGLLYFSMATQLAKDDERLDVRKIEFESEEELLKARVFDCIRKEEIFGEYNFGSDSESADDDPNEENHDG